jgi:acyl carrier protein
MEINDFISNFSELFEETDRSKFKPVTRFRDIEEWSSLTALSVIAMVDEKYHIKLTGDDIRKSQSVEDIFNLVKAKK